MATAGTHKSLGISTPPYDGSSVGGCSGIWQYGHSDQYIDFNTYSISGNTPQGGRPAIRFGASGFDFYANTDDNGFADTPHFSINEGGYSYFSGKLGIGTALLLAMYYMLNLAQDGDKIHVSHGAMSALEIQRNNTSDNILFIKQGRAYTSEIQLRKTAADGDATNKGLTLKGQGAGNGSSVK